MPGSRSAAAALASVAERAHDVLRRTFRGGAGPFHRRLRMADVSYYRSPGHGVLPDNLGRSAGNLFSTFDFNSGVPPLQPGFALTAISRDAPVKEAPITLTNPFDLSRSPLGVLVNEYLWHHLLFDPRPLSRNLFFKSDSTAIPHSNLFEPVPINPQEGSPILPQQFR
jgi:hypothetical protein